MRKTLILAVLVVVAVAHSQYPGARPVPGKWARGFNSIKIADAKDIVGFLAGPDCLGRSPKQSGYAVAAGYCTAFLRQNGIAPAGDDGSYFQRFTIDRVTITPDTGSFGTDDGAFKLEWLNDFSISSTEEIDLPLQLAFVSIAATTKLEELDLAQVKDRLVLFHPGNFSSNREVSSNALAAITNAGATAIVTPSTGTRSLTSLQLTSLRGTASAVRPLNFLNIKDAAAQRIATAFQANNFATATPDKGSVELATKTIRLRAKVTRTEDHTTMNVLAKIPGADPELASEAVVVGAHLDHFGVSAQGVRWGADDNASGSTAAMLIARAIAQNPVKPKRTVIVALWSDEELGLYGSEYYANKPAIPLTKTVAYFNMDQVGRNGQFPRWGDVAENNLDAAYCGSAKLCSPDLYALMHDVNQYVNLNLRDDKEDRTMRSDTGSFFKRDVPVVKAFTGEHPDYHAITDTAEKVNYEKLISVAKWLYLAAMETATRPIAPRFDKGAKYLSGTVTVKDPITLSSDAIIDVTLVDSSRADAPAIVLDRTVSKRPGQLPQRWTLRYRPADLKPEATYVVRARITDRGKLMYSSATQIRVLQPAQQTSGIEIQVTPASGG